MYRIIILLFVSSILGDNIINLEDQKYVMILSDPTYTYNETAFLYHIANLTRILAPYEDIMHTAYNIDSYPELKIIVNRIETLKAQLLPHNFRAKRSLNFLGSILKFITGTPDHADLIEIKTTLNALIENNNKQKVINSQFERILETIDLNTITKNLIISEIYEELKSITNTINFAKNNEYFSGTLNMQDVKEILSHEQLDLPIISILEYSDIHILSFRDSIITIYKYPILKEKCKLYNIHSLSYKQGKLNLDPKIAQCNNKFKRVSKCKNYIGNYICKLESKDNCTINILENKPAQCETIHENNVPLKVLENGHILVDYEHHWNNAKITGPNLIHFNYSTNIDGIIYYNTQQQLIDVIKNRHNESIEILKIITTNSDYKFNNIQEISTFLIPIEENPGKFAICFITGTLTTALIIYGLTQFCKCCQQRQMRRRQEQFNELYQIELNNIQQRLVTLSSI